MPQRPLRVGQHAPPFSLKTADGRAIRLSDFLGQHVVLYFYPKDDTPGCTKEACDFQAHVHQFTQADAVVLGVSCDDVASHQRFAGKFGLTFSLLSDPGASISKAYGVCKRKSLYGRTYWGIERATFLIDPRGRIARVFPKVSVDGHVEALLQALRRAGDSSPAQASARATRATGRKA